MLALSLRAAGFLACLAATTVAQAADGVVTFGLIPHHVHARRLAQERGYVPEELVPDRPHRYGRSRQLDTDLGKPTPVSELFQGYGTHYADLWCGTPPQRQTVIVDTGSGVTAFPCSGCADCGVPKYHADGLFDEDSSGTFEALGCEDCLRGRCRGEECRISMSYQEGSSWTAFEALDHCYIGGMHGAVTVDKNGFDFEHPGVAGADFLDPFHAPSFGFGMKFGCQTHLTGLFISQLADGIMGMDNAKAAYWKQMYEAGVIAREAFSLCYSRHDEVSPLGTESGSMTLGGTDKRLHSDDMVFCDTNMGNGFYGIKLRQMHLRPGGGGKSAVSSDANSKVVNLGIPADQLARGQFIVDSGTTDTYFARSFNPYFKKAFKEMAGFDYGHSKVKLTLEELTAMPTILFQIEGDEAMNQAVQDGKKGQQVVGLANEVDPEHPFDVLVAMPPSHYMEYEPDSDMYIARFYLEEGSGGVFGANAMMGHDVYFDVSEGRIGWAESSCDYTELMKDHFPEFLERESTNKGVEPEKHEFDDDTPVVADDDKPAYDDEIDLHDSEFCSSTFCQAGMVAAVVSAVVFIAMRMLRKTEVEYDSASGLELQSAAAKPDPSEDFGVGYRDDEGGFRDDDELSPHELS